MKGLLVNMAMLVLKQLLALEAVHEKLRELAKKSENKLDDLAVEKLIELLKELPKLL
jgi:hypothetical protein